MAVKKGEEKAIATRMPGIASVTTVLYQGQDAADANGVWMTYADLQMGAPARQSLFVEGTFTGTLHICGSNKLTKPDATDHGVQIGSNITAAGLTEFTMPCRWYKVRISAMSAGSLNAMLHAVAY